MSETGVELPLILYGPSGSEANVFGLTGANATQQPTPYVNAAQQMIHYGSRWGQSTAITLDGQITGENHDILVDYRTQIINNFNNNQFGRFVIKENNSEIYTKDVCKIESINFGSNTYSKILDYNISIRSYDPTLFTGTYGVLQPVNKIEYSEQEDGLIKITHSISAQGFNTSANYNNAFENAYNYVRSLTGLSKGTSSAESLTFPSSGDVAADTVSGTAMYFMPTGVSTPQESHPVQINSISESIDRFAGTYSVTENYTFDSRRETPSGLTYSPVINKSIDVKHDVKDDFKTVNMDVTLLGGLSGYSGASWGANFSVDQLQEYAKDHVIPNMADWAESLSNITGLHPSPVSTSVSVDRTNLKINSVFDNNPLFSGGNAYFDYKVSVDKDYVTDIHTVKINGEIMARGNLKQKFHNAKSFFITGLEPNLNPYLASLASGVYTGIIGNCFEMNPKPENVNVNEDSINGTISISASFNDRDFFGGASGDYSIDTPKGVIKASEFLSDVKYNWSLNASMPVYKEIPSSNQVGLYMIYDGNLNTREQVALNVDGIGTKEASDMDTILTFLDSYTMKKLYPVHIDNSKNPIASKFDGSRSYSNANTSISFTQEKKHKTFDKEKTKIIGKYIN